jgi:hypothetical protein
VTASPTIRVYPADLGGCGFHRIIWPAESLARSGAPVTVVRPDAPDDEQIQATWWNDDDGTRRLVGVAPVEADVVVLQRPLTDTLAEAIPRLQAQGVRVVVEIDDDFEAISRRNVSWPSVDPMRSPRRNRTHLRHACELADLVVCSTPALAERYGSHGRVRVVRNRVPSHYLGLEAARDKVPTVGWSGSIETHPDDLQVTGGGVARALLRAGGRFGVVGTGKGVQRALGLAVPPVATGWLPIEAYPRALAMLDVGIVPLELTPFNEAKSALKLMEMAALGVVPVVSPTAENVRLAADVGAIVAETPRAWGGVLKRLLRDGAWRQEQGERVRQGMRRHTIEGNAGEWFDAWASAVNTPCAA